MLHDQAGAFPIEDSPEDYAAATTTELPATRPSRLIVIANRLPVSAVRNAEGRWALQAWPYEPDGLDVRPPGSVSVLFSRLSALAALASLLCAAVRGRHAYAGSLVQSRSEHWCGSADS